MLKSQPKKLYFFTKWVHFNFPQTFTCITHNQQKINFFITSLLANYEISLQENTISDEILLKKLIQNSMQIPDETEPLLEFVFEFVFYLKVSLWPRSNLSWRAGRELARNRFATIDIHSLPGADTNGSEYFRGITFKQPITYAGYQSQRKRISHPKILLISFAVVFAFFWHQRSCVLTFSSSWN